MGAMYDERLSAPAAMWLLPVGSGISFMLVFVIFGPIPGLLGLVIGGAAAAMLVSSYGSPRIRVVQGQLVAGDARIPVSALGTAEVLDKEAAFTWRTAKADARAFMLLRGYIPTAVRIPVTDPEDPTPYLYLSTRTPERLAQVLASAKAETVPAA
ncbi:DUF3093 domain-containing protein [Streptacidiphilus sp. NEAU-YB345]|uniref:DUF3093 domain-containing protein n=2 Tax=Streptacidiphilus fuscans TaxID=2789292 RepID=A0A931BC43_9ACTN|nr:DUF3093 domain-containing protein [Streptacidiphilus fuscans]MBF9071498.1 DUF3093 domain-containing protein [Streptacidiphilus fuscans]